MSVEATDAFPAVRGYLLWKGIVIYLKEKEFNLIDEPWIRVLDKKCHIVELSLSDALLHSQDCLILAGETEPQNVAVLRFMLAVLHSVYARVDENGNAAPLPDDPDAAKDRWNALLRKGSFSKKAITDYLKKWHERFWLFHPERPIMQAGCMTEGTIISAAKINGEISESENKDRFSAVCAGIGKNELSYSQAARWLLNLHLFDDKAIKSGDTAKARKAAGEDVPTVNIGWLGTGSPVYIQGDSLFETLMFNLIMINDGDVQNKPHPTWEYDTVKNEERFYINMPDNLAELYSTHFRRIHLIRSDSKDVVVMARCAVGDVINQGSLAKEPMTMLTKKKGRILFKSHDPSRQMWRDFGPLFIGSKTDSLKPGIIQWYQETVQDSVSDRFIRVTLASVKYDNKGSKIIDLFSDSLVVNAALLDTMNDDWRARIDNEINKCEKAADGLAAHALHVYIAAGGSANNELTTNSIKTKTRTEFYCLLDREFRSWIRSIDLSDNTDDYKDSKQAEWERLVYRIASDQAVKIAQKGGAKAIIGKIIGDGLSNIYASPKSMNILKGRLNKLYPNSYERT